MVQKFSLGNTQNARKKKKTAKIRQYEVSVGGRGLTCEPNWRLFAFGFGRQSGLA
jgi:hypothetical protein